MPFFQLVIIVVVTVLVGVFVAQNPLPISLQFVALKSVELPLGFVMALAGGLGALTVGIASVLIRRRSLSLAARQLQSRLNESDPTAVP